LWPPTLTPRSMDTITAIADQYIRRGAPGV
jgi:hypothetical protein